MAPGQTYTIPNRNNIPTTYTEYKIQPSDFNKRLMDIAREHLHDESLHVDILRKTNDTLQGSWWVTLDDNNPVVGNDWTLLLPPARAVHPVQPAIQHGMFTLTQEANIRTSPKVEAGNVFLVGRIGTQYTYDINSRQTDANGMTWVDVSPTDFHGKAVPGAKYWICVREGNISHTNPPL